MIGDEKFRELSREYHTYRLKIQLAILLVLVLIFAVPMGVLTCIANI